MFVSTDHGETRDPGGRSEKPPRVAGSEGVGIGTSNGFALHTVAPRTDSGECYAANEQRASTNESGGGSFPGGRFDEAWQRGSPSKSCNKTSKGVYIILLGKRARMHTNRRQFLVSAGAGAAVGLAGCLGGDDDGSGDGGSDGDGSDGGTTGDGGVDVDNVEVGFALPLSGNFAVFGEEMELAADMAVERINENGGIQSLGGAEIVAVKADVGDSSDSTTTAVQNMIDRNDVVAAFGSFVSALTVAARSVAQRNGLPWFTGSFADQITGEDFTYVFRNDIKSSDAGDLTYQTMLGLADDFDDSIERIAVAGDNTEGTTQVAEGIVGNAESDGMDVVVHETWTPTLNNATPIVRDMRDGDPDLIWITANAPADITAIVNEYHQFDLDVPIVFPVTANLPALADLGPERIGNLFAYAPVWPLAGQESFIQEFGERGGSDFPYPSFGSNTIWGGVHILKEGLEEAGSTNRDVIRDTMEGIEITEGPATDAFAVDAIRYDDERNIVDLGLPHTQWLDSSGVDFIDLDFAPLTVRPEADKLIDPVWAGLGL